MSVRIEVGLIRADGVPGLHTVNMDADGARNVVDAYLNRSGDGLTFQERSSLDLWFYPWSEITGVKVIA
jgi:hypothetical protein